MDIRHRQVFSRVGEGHVDEASGGSSDPHPSRSQALVHWKTCSPAPVDDADTTGRVHDFHSRQEGFLH